MKSTVSADAQELALTLLAVYERAVELVQWPVAEHVLAGLEELAREDPDLEDLVDMAHLHAASAAQRQ